MKTLASVLARLGMHFHWQDLRRDDRRGWFSGRAWLRWAMDERTGRAKAIRAEWSAPSRTFGLTVDVHSRDSESDVTLYMGLPLLTVWLATERVLPRAWRTRTNGHETGLKWHNGRLWLAIWNDTNEWRSTDPWWRHSSVCPADLLLGRQNFERRVLWSGLTQVPLPERSYLAAVTLTECTWRRPRWPRPMRRRSAEVDVEGGIPVPGKGENSWDIEDGAIYSLSCPAATVPEAVASMVKSVLERRQRHADLNWRPSEAAADA